MTKTQSYLLGVGTGLVITLILMMNITNDLEQQMISNENSLKELKESIISVESEMLSTEIYTFQHRSGNTERIEVIENTFLDYDIARKLDKLLEKAIDNGVLLQ